MGSLLYFDCFSGISGDMTLGAFLDLGIDRDQFQRHLGLLALDGYHLEIKSRQVNGIAATDVEVIEDETAETHRHFDDIRSLIESSKLSKDTKQLAINIFTTIAASEARIHDQPLEQVHFHEVGAIDSIVDIVGAAICINLLNPERIVASPLNLGSGTVSCAHGILPVPAPATADILKGTPVYSSEIQGELVTPTGAAIIKTIANDFGTMPPMTIDKIGYGSGKKQFRIPNLLRIFKGTEAPGQRLIDQDLLLLETNIDDMNPELFSYLIPLLLEKGALDATLTQLIMKKGRPGVMLSVLCEKEQSSLFEELIFAETTTLGIRKSAVSRSSLERSQLVISTDLGSVRVKLAFYKGSVLKATPEYEDCRRLAEQNQLPLRAVYQRIRQSEAFLNLL